MTKKDVKNCFSIKKLILTSKQCGEYPFAGQNTQHLMSKLDFLTTRLY